MAQQFRIGSNAPQGLFLRSEPVVRENTKVTVLPMGHLVRKIADSSVAGWWKVDTMVDNVALSGFVNSTFLITDQAFTPPAASNQISSVHLSTDSPVVRASAQRPAFPLNETGKKTRNPAGTPAVRAQQLTAIINWLDVENKQRYAPTSVKTFCNIYAYDYCFLSDVYLPRVWWMPSALVQLANGRSVSPIYAQTVSELNANSLYGWLKEFGPSFHWRRTFDLTEMQDAANNGRVVIICAQNRLLNRSGHICAVTPETQGNVARRNGAAVISPLQSQAGRTNLKYFARNWWTADTFSEFGFWINDL